MLRFGILGPLVVDRDGRPLAVPTGRARVLLGALLVHTGTALSVDALVDIVWGDLPPRTAATALHGHVSRLRKVLGDESVQTTATGYRLGVDAEAVDSARFKALVDAAGHEPDAAARSRVLRDALSLWRGPALADFCFEPFAQPFISTLEEMRVTAVEDAVEADLAMGRHTAVISEVRAFVREHPLRERLWGQLMIALYRSGRQAEALATYHAARQRLVDELGVEPGPALRKFEAAILRQDAALAAPESVTPDRAAPSSAVLRLRPGGADARFVGRDAELERLQAILSGVLGSRRPALVTVIGEPGIGKSRLVGEFTSRVQGEVSVVSGQCQAENKDTYAPLHALIAQVRIDPDSAATVAPLLARLRQALDTGVAVPGRVIDAAAVAFFAAVAQRRPLLVVLEDIHWAQPALLDLVEAMAANDGAPILTVCLARSEIAQVRPTLTGADGAMTVHVGPLPAGDVRRVVLDVAELGAADESVDEIVSIADGNPLFALQLVASAADPTALSRQLMPAIRTLLANRIGALAPGELAVVRAGAIAGADFRLDAIQALLPAEAQLAAARHLDVLTRRQLVRPIPDGYRFRHDLIRRTAYLATDPSIRARLHETYANWLSSNDGVGTSTDELIGYHLESARDNLPVLGEHDEHGRRLGGRAATHFAKAGYRALGRWDLAGAADLLTRAVHLLPRDDPERRSMMVDACGPLRRSGRTREALAYAREAVDIAVEVGDVVTEWRARLELAFVRAFVLASVVSDETLPVAEEAVAALRPLGDDRGLGMAWVMIGQAREAHGRLTDAATAYGQALQHARRVPSHANGGQIAWGLAAVLVEGPTPVPDAIARCRDLTEWQGNTIPGVLLELAKLHAMSGDIDEARSLLSNADQIFREWGHRRGPIYQASAQARVELDAGAAEEAERHARRGLEFGANVGGDESDAANALLLARALVRQGRFDEVEDVVRTYAGVTSTEDVGPAAGWNAVRAEIRIHHGSWDSAIELGRRAVDAIDQTELFTVASELRLTLAAALRGAGDDAGARLVAAEAVHMFATKGNVAGLTRVRSPWTDGISVA